MVDEKGFVYGQDDAIYANIALVRIMPLLANVIEFSLCSWAMRNDANEQVGRKRKRHKPKSHV